MKFKLFLHSVIFLFFPVLIYAQANIVPTEEQLNGSIAFLTYLIPILFLAISALYWQQIKEMKAGSAERAERLKILEIQQTNDRDNMLKALILSEQTLQNAVIVIENNRKVTQELMEFLKTQKQ